MSSLTAFAILSALLLVLSCSYVVDTKPVRGRRHSAVKTTSHTVHREKRATVADILGDLTAASPGILNEDRVPLRHCKEIYDDGQTTSGLYRINPGGSEAEFTVFCDMKLRNGGWTIIERRVNDDTSFNRSWKAYRNGYGEFNENFWLGLQKIKDITDCGTFELYIGLHSFHPTDTVTFALYNSFSLDTEANKYALGLGTYDLSSTAGDALLNHDGEKFSTPDQDNDANSMRHCASEFSAGWWYNNCHDSHLTGIWYANGILPDVNVPDGIIWETWRGDTESLQSVVMAVRPK